MERVWVSRLRWRLRGAPQWPLFGVMLVVDAVLLHELPIAGEGSDWFLSFLESAFFNIILVAVVAPLGGRLLRRRRPDLPAIVASDYAGAVALVALAVGLAALGVGHHSQVAAQRAAFVEGLARVRSYVTHNAPAEYRRRVAETTALRFGSDLYRACVPGDDPKRWLCLFVFTDQHPPGLRRDTNRAPNSSWFPPDRGG
jgi:hypothetical protein